MLVGVEILGTDVGWSGNTVFSVAIKLHSQAVSKRGAGIAQWLEHRTHD